MREPEDSCLLPDAICSDALLQVQNAGDDAVDLLASSRLSDEIKSEVAELKLGLNDIKSSMEKSISMISSGDEPRLCQVPLRGRRMTDCSRKIFYIHGSDGGQTAGPLYVLSPEPLYLA